MVKASTACGVAIAALVLAALVALTAVIGLPLVVNGLTPSKDFVQSGTLSWDIFFNNTVVLDTVTSTYSLYQGPTYYTLELALLPRDLLVPNDAVNTLGNLRIRAHTFVPAVVALSSYGQAGKVVPLATNNIAALAPDGACYDPPTPTCNVVAVPGLGLETQNAIAFAIESPQSGYAYFYLQTISGSVQNWSNYTFGLTRILSLTIGSA
jgi:hypothetical protein